MDIIIYKHRIGPMASAARVNNSCQDVCRRINFQYYNGRAVYVWIADSSVLQIVTDHNGDYGGSVGTGSAIPVVATAAYAPQPQQVHIASAAYASDVETRPVPVMAQSKPQPQPQPQGLTQYAVQNNYAQQPQQEAPQVVYAQQANNAPQATATSAPQANYTPQANYIPQQAPVYGNGAFAVHPQ